MARIAIVTGIMGQDGSLLAELLLSKGYDVHGIVRSLPNADWSAPSSLLRDALKRGQLVLHAADIVDRHAVKQVVGTVAPGEIYNLAGQTHVGQSFVDPWTTATINAIGALNVMLAAREADPAIRLFQAGSADMFGIADRVPQDESTPLNPQSPYASSKVFAHQMVQQMRASHDALFWNGILYPHESTRRQGSFVIRKVTQGVASILAGAATELALGNLAARRDWGAAQDTVLAMWLMLQSDVPDDYVVATGYAHSVEELVATAFGLVDLDWENYVRVDPAFFRPIDPHLLVGDSTKLKAALGWTPRTGFEALIGEILAHDLRDCALDPAQYPRLARHLAGQGT